MERYILANLERVFGKGGQAMANEEKKAITERTTLAKVSKGCRNKINFRNT